MATGFEDSQQPADDCESSAKEAASAKVSASASRAAIFWPGMVVGLLVMQLVICGVAIVLASSNGGPVVVDDYHQRALDWDKQQAAKRAGEKLKWVVVWRMEPEADVLGQRLLRIDVVDRERQPVAGANIDGYLFHHAHGNDRRKLELEEMRPGSYTMLVKAKWSGIWQLQMEVASGDDVLVIDEEQSFTFPVGHQVRELPR